MSSPIIPTSNFNFFSDGSDGQFYMAADKVKTSAFRVIRLIICLGLTITTAFD